MSGIVELDVLLKNMDPQLSEEEFVFCCIALQDCEKSFSQNVADIDPIGIFREEEGTTLVLSRKKADENNLSYEAVFKQITLRVHSSLEAVGLTAAVATALTKADISANVIAAYHHDHIFVPANKADKALKALMEI
ncbi:ACT domain-containing protein [Aliikangiella coralliicola]|uniref:ACT domain-containing protein n=1 Tax=Aliikangiella coralliicola TaxID=2592383 RepID=A0A545U7Q2_9GAMM|nr:ACT domain-containing protein [Aliikangiella coralliicola]TQV85488.1 ACT domain-containing protein [Aliikangiella coralliicola]